MSFLLIRSIKLGRATRDAWRAVGGVFAPRGLTGQQRMEMAREHEFVINLGNTMLNAHGYPVPVLNKPDTIRPLVTPGGTRRLLGPLLPDQTCPGAVWVKAPGRAGKGKYLVDIDQPLVLPEDWDWQQHIDGQEYRLITVNGKVVQDFLRYGENGSRVYEWIRMSEVPAHVKDTARAAAALVGGDSVIAWDIIAPHRAEKAYILEGNTSPGMSPNTARRIVDQIRKDL